MQKNGTKKDFFVGSLTMKQTAENTTPPARRVVGTAGWGRSDAKKRTGSLLVGVDLDIARRGLILPQQQRSRENDGEGGEHGEQSLENFHGVEPP